MKLKPKCECKRLRKLGEAKYGSNFQFHCPKHGRQIEYYDVFDPARFSFENVLMPSLRGELGEDIQQAAAKTAKRLIEKRWLI